MRLSVTLMMTNGALWFLRVPIRYLIPSLDRAHAGHYRCIVRNRVGAIMQCSTEVQVACKCGLVFLISSSSDGGMGGQCFC